MAKIVFTPSELEDMKSIKTYFTDELCNEGAAINIIEKIMKRIHLLENFPEMGKQLSSVIDFEVSYRFIVCDNCIAFYKIREVEVIIIRVINRINFMQILFKNPNDNNY